MHIEEDVALFEQVYIVFQGEAGLWWLRWLRPGFRHCYLLIRLPGANDWLELNPCSNRMVVSLRRCSCGFDYLHYLSSVLKRKVVGCAVKTPHIPAPVMPFTCVEFVKRVVGCRDRMVVTPYQLYKKIKNCRK